MTKEQIISIFIEFCGSPQSIDKLTEYLDFVISSKKDDSFSEYCETHHILPRGQFLAYRNSEWNLVKLKYEDHIRAHELLFIAYPIRKNQRTLNFMKSDVNKNSELISKAAKNGWKNLKLDTKKYENWRNSRINYMKNHSSDLQSKRAKHGWDTPEKYERRSQINKENWTPELRAWKSKSMSQYFKDNPQEIADRNQKRWDNLSNEKREQFNNKMKIVNSDPKKRAKAGDKIRQKWKDPEYRDKMKNRNMYKLSFKFISPTGEIYERLGFFEMINEFNFSPYFVNKFKNTGKPVITTKKSQDALNTLGWTFFQQ